MSSKSKEDRKLRAKEKLDAERAWKKEELDRVQKQWVSAWKELQPGPQPQDHRIDELADQVARLTKIVEQLAGRLEETEKKKNVPR